MPNIIRSIRRYAEHPKLHRATLVLACLLLSGLRSQATCGGSYKFAVLINGCNWTGAGSCTSNVEVIVTHLYNDYTDLYTNLCCSGLSGFQFDSGDYITVRLTNGIHEPLVTVMACTCCGPCVPYCVDELCFSNSVTALVDGLGCTFTLHGGCGVTDCTPTNWIDNSCSPGAEVERPSAFEVVGVAPKAPTKPDLIDSGHPGLPQHQLSALSEPRAGQPPVISRNPEAVSMFAHRQNQRPLDHSGGG